MVKARSYSPTRLSVYQGCARRYYYQYVIKVPRARTAAQSQGVSLHGALEAMHKAGGLAATGLDGAIALLWARWEKEGFADEAEEAAAREQAQAMLAEYLKGVGDGPGKPVLIEKAIAAELMGVPFYGILDRVDQLPDGSLELIDYKSGRERPVTAAVRQQLAIYRSLVEAHMGRAPTAVSIHHLATSTRVAVELAPGEWREAVAAAAETARAIEADEDFVPTLSAACSRCDYAGRCLAFKRQAHDAIASL